MLTASTGFVTLAFLLIAACVAFLLLTGAVNTLLLFTGAIEMPIKWHYGVAAFALIVAVCHGALGIYHTFFA
jgi:hypothetical protein